MGEITFEEFKKRWDQLKEAKKIRKSSISTELIIYHEELNIIIREKTKELEDLFPEAIKSI